MLSRLCCSEWAVSPHKIGEGKTGEKEKENPPGAVQGAPASDILSRTAIKLVVK